jgi:hypothetical protein
MKAAVLRRPYTVPFRGATDFIHASDTAAAFLAAAERAPQGAHVYNLHGDSVEVVHILATIQDLDPAGGARLSLTGSPLAIPPAISSTNLTRDLGPLPKTPYAKVSPTPSPTSATSPPPAASTPATWPNQSCGLQREPRMLAAGIQVDLDGAKGKPCSVLGHA